MSGVPRKREIKTPHITPEALKDFDEMWKSHKYRFVMFEESDGDIGISHSGKKGECTFQDFVSNFPKDKCAYAVLYFTYRTISGGFRGKQCFLSFIPDSLRMEPKFVGGTAGGILKGELNEKSTSQFNLTVNDIEDLTTDMVWKKVSKFELDEIDWEGPVCQD